MGFLHLVLVVFGCCELKTVVYPTIQKIIIILNLLWNIKEHSLRNVSVFFSLFISFFTVHTVKVSGLQHCLTPNVLQNIFFDVPWKKEIHTSLG